MRWVLVITCIGCGGGSDSPPDAPPLPAFGDVMPQVGGGTHVLTSPSVVTITADTDPNRADFEAFATAYAGSPAWATQTAEFGIGALTVGTPQHIATAPTTDQGAIDLMTANLTGATPAWGAPDPSAIYAFYIPANAAFDDGTGALCCSDYFGYHFDAVVGGVDLPYTIICTCTDDANPEMTPLQVTTSTASHEIVETASDPFVDPPGFFLPDDDHVAWTTTTGGELADLCEFADTAYWTNAPLIDPKFALQRSWSNAAARAGHDPCIGDAAGPYYQTIPEAPDAVALSIDGETVNTHGIQIANGATGTVTLHVYADDDSAGPYTVTLNDVSSEFGGLRHLTFDQPTGSYRAGDTVTAQVTVRGGDAQFGNRAEVFEVVTTPANGPSTYFYALVTQ